MISATRMLCQKYTDLTDAEISYLESYGALLPALANAEQADVFIDCRTVSGRSAIVVCEAKPQTVPSNYRSSILGMLIHWRDEPAVDRSFRLAVPLLIIMFLIRLVSTLIFSGLITKAIGDGLAKTGLLKGYALGRAHG